MTVAEELRAAVDRLDDGAPVYAPGTARVGRFAQNVAMLAICDQHGDPANAPPLLDGNGHCALCVFVETYDLDLARQIAALINARKPLAAWLQACAGQAQAMGHPTDFGICDEPSSVQEALLIARAINGGRS